MTTRSTRVAYAADPNAVDAIEAAAELVRSGGVVAFPTETVYGLGAAAHNASAVERIFEAKGRPANKALIVHVADIEQARAFAKSFPPSARRLAERFWPGPLSLVLERACDVPDVVCGGGATVALRAPAHPVALEFIRRVGDGVAAPSANRASRLPPLRGAHVLKSLDGRIDMLLDAGTCPGGLESTVLDVRAEQAVILRRGAVSIEQIRELVPVVDLPRSSAPSRDGQHKWLLIEEPEALEASARQSAGRVAVVGFSAIAGLDCRVMSEDPRQYAARIYDVLHELEDAGYERVIVQALSQDSGWAGIRDRLQRISVASSSEQ